MFLFQEERKTLLEKLSQILPKFLSFTKSCQLETILFGINDYNLEPEPGNIPIVFAVQKFILDKQCFKSEKDYMTLTFTKEDGTESQTYKHTDTQTHGHTDNTTYTLG